MPNNYSVKYIYEAIDNMSQTIKKVDSGMKRVNRTFKAATRMARTLDKQFDPLRRKMKSLSDTANKVSNSFNKVGKAMMLRVTAPILGLGVGALKAASDMETLKTSFVGMLGDAEKAKKIVGELNEFTAKTPFQLADVAGSARKLLAAQIPVKDIKDTLQLLGDVSAAANVPLGDMSAIFAKIKNKGKAMTEEILQMSDRGIPIIDTLSKMFGISGDKVLEASSKSQISFDIITKALKKMQEKGGFAHKAMILQSKTLAGVFSTLKDNIIITAASLGEILLPHVKKFATAAIDVAQNVKEWVKNNPRLATLSLIVAGIVALIPPLLIGVGMAAKGFALMTAGAAALSLPLIVVGAKIALVIAAVGALAFVFKKLWGKISANKVLMERLGKIASNLKTIFMAVAGVIRSALGSAIEWVSSKLDSLLGSKFFTSILNFTAGALEGITGSLADTATSLAGSPVEASPVSNNVNVNSKSSTDINMNINAPEGVVGGVQSTSKGANFNLGVNMAGAR